MSEVSKDRGGSAEVEALRLLIGLYQGAGLETTFKPRCHPRLPPATVLRAITSLCPETATRDRDRLRWRFSDMRVV